MSVAAHSMHSQVNTRRADLVFFYSLAILCSWAAWAPLALAARGWTRFHFSPYLHLLGGLGPTVAALVTILVFDGKAGVLSLAERAFAARGRAVWIVVGIVAPLAVFAISASVVLVAGKGPLEWSSFGTSSEYPGLTRWQYWIASLLFYGFGEEIGWRGFALPRLQRSLPALSSALWLGSLWALWHLPLFAFAPGLSAMGAGGAVGWLVSMIVGSILLTWLFNSSSGSLLAVALFHGVLDITMAAPLAPLLPSIMGAILAVSAVVIVRVMGPSNLSRRDRVRV
jgi:membrane protease YdiL (CAAX protease family)